MTTIILVSIGLLLAAVSALFVVFYGGDAFGSGDVKAAASTLMNAGLNVESAQQGYAAAHGGVATDLEDLKGSGDDSWMEMHPAVHRVTKGDQRISMDDGFVAYTIAGIPEDVCRRVNVEYGLKDADTAEIPADMSKSMRGCYTRDDDNLYYVRFDGRTASGEEATARPVLATSVVIRHPYNDCIEISELEIHAEGGNVAPAGRLSSSTPYAPQANASWVIDGVKPAGYPQIFHSKCTAGDYLRVDLAKPAKIDSIRAWGRPGYYGRAAWTVYTYSGEKLISFGTLNATSGSGQAVQKDVPALTTPPVIPSATSSIEDHIEYAKWYGGEWNRFSSLFDQKFAIETLKRIPLPSELYFTNVTYEYGPWYSRYGWDRYEHYIYFSLAPGVTPGSPFCQAWASLKPANAGNCDAYYGNHFTIYAN